MFGWVDKLIERRQRGLREKAWPTLKALCAFCPQDYMRGLDRLFLDGGSMEGFRACQKLGWARDCCPSDRYPGYGTATPLGRAFWEANKE